MLIRTVTAADAAAISTIYNHYIEQTIITFVEQPLSTEETLAQINEALDKARPYVVAEQDGEIIGFAYASPWSGRCGYRYTLEVTVYLAPDKTGQGAGQALYQALFEQLRKGGYHSVVAAISLPNPSSIALHERFGMQKVGHFAEVGYKFGRWIDVGYWHGKV